MSMTGSPRTTDLQQQLRMRLASAGLTAVERDGMEAAMAVSFEVHRLQKPRPDGTPYVDHPLRVALSLLASGEVPDTDLVIAALLHDSVEDQAARLCELLAGTAPDTSAAQAEVALAALSSRFGPRVAQMVGRLTNPDFDALVAGLDEPERTARKNALYAHHVLALVDTDPAAFLIKFADFAENALSLHQVTDSGRRGKLRRKYGPVVGGLIGRLRALGPTHLLAAHRGRMLPALEDAWLREYAASV